MFYMSKFPVYSIIIPVFNEEGNIWEIYSRVSEILRTTGEDYEIIFVNDGSRDNSLNILKELSQKDSAIKVVNFSRNFGHQIAVSAGIDNATGQAIVIMDADLQDPPEVVLEFFDKWKEGYEVVYGKRKERLGETAFKKITASVFYWLLNKLSRIEIPRNVSDFRLIDRKVVDVLREMKEQHRFLRGMVSWVGFNQAAVEFVRPPRFSGETHWPFKRMLKFAIDGILSFSMTPLRFASYMGLLSAFVSFLATLYILIEKFVYHNTIQGWASLLVAVLFLGGVQLIMIGLLGEYIGRIHEEVKGRPLYIVKEKIGFDE